MWKCSIEYPHHERVGMGRDGTRRVEAHSQARSIMTRYAPEARRDGSATATELSKRLPRTFPIPATVQPERTDDQRNATQRNVGACLGELFRAVSEERGVQQPRIYWAAPRDRTNGKAHGKSLLGGTRLFAALCSGSLSSKLHVKLPPSCAGCARAPTRSTTFRRDATRRPALSNATCMS